MLKFLVCVSFVLAVASAEAKDTSPWFGSEANPPEQISLASNSDQFSVDAAVSSVDPDSCLLEGCPLPKNLGKEDN